MIEPVSDALTTSIRPACSAKNAMISSAMLPNVALRMPPTCGPVSDPRRSVERPTTQASPRIADGRRRRTGPSRRRAAPKSRTIATTLTTTVAEQEDPRRRRERAEDRAGRRSGAAGHGRSCDPAHPGDVQSGDAPYSVRRGMPVAAATRRAASPRATPSATSRSTSARAAVERRRAVASRRPAPAARPSTHRPRARTRRAPGCAPSAAAAASSPSVPADDRLVELRELAADGRRAGRAPHAVGEVAQRRRHPARRLEHDRPALVGGDPREPLAPLAPGPRQEPLERPARTGDARRGDGRQHGRRARDRHDRAALRGPRRDELGARVADTTGVPASVTSARSAPPRRCVEQRRASRAGPLRAW